MKKIIVALSILCAGSAIAAPNNPPSTDKGGVYDAMKDEMICPTEVRYSGEDTIRIVLHGKEYKGKMAILGDCWWQLYDEKKNLFWINVKNADIIEVEGQKYEGQKHEKQ